MPDVIVWMIVGKKRKAVKRFQAHDLMYAPSATGGGHSKYKGKYCGKMQLVTLKVSNAIKIADLHSKRYFTLYTETPLKGHP